MIAFLVSSASAGPWVHAPGSGYTKLALLGSLANDEDSDLHNRCGAASLYGERGLLPHTELLFELPYVSCSNRFGDSALSYRTQGFGTARAGLGFSPARSLPLALHALVRLPLAAPEGTPLHPPLSDSQIDLDLLLSVGGSLPIRSHRAWGIAELGIRDRTDLRPVAGIGYPGAEILYRGQLGLLPSDLGWLQVEALGQEDLRGGRALHRLGGGLAVRLARGLHAEVGSYRTYAARGALPGWAMSVGLSHIDPP